MPDPNVLVICCDDLGYGDLGCYGAEYETPNIDRLAADGVRFTDWHSNAPVCSPSRASLLTGRYPQHAGLPGNAPPGRPETDPDLGLSPDQPTIAEALSDAGYHTGAFGKWHLGMTDRDNPLAHGFDECFGFRSGCVDYYSHIMVWAQGGDIPPYHDLWNGREEVWHDGEYLTHQITERTVEFVLDTEAPFFGYVAYNAPHYPMHAPREYFERFSHLEGERRTHAAMIAAVDDGVGEILAALEAEGIAEETLVIFTSDHGPSREVRNHLDGSLEPYEGGSTGGHRGHKFSLFEGGIRIPGIVRYPAAFDGDRVCDELVLSMDVLPTILTYCSVEDPHARDGESLRDVLDDDAATPHDRVYWAFNEQCAVRDGDWKLVLDGRKADLDGGDSTPAPAAEEVVLANLADDPAETDNRADDEPQLVADLELDVRAWCERWSA
ncbi:sulfatase family protein [Halomontanus rarus]|uniref:sulfatase family protein n=1 Tax=Halomontanus rarus TaxID=3034020 RepID=UPI0023E855CA|nr:sulfatase-like hydrolase/transferase [Halovivax sp. TS33]